jgi:hypothetical protein
MIDGEAVIAATTARRTSMRRGANAGVMKRHCSRPT